MLLIIFPVFLFANDTKQHTAPDSIRQAARLRSCLFIGGDDMPSALIDRAIREKMPLAFRLTSRNKNEVEGWATKASEEKIPLVVITDDVVSVGGTAFRDAMMLPIGDINQIEFSEGAETTRTKSDRGDFLLVSVLSEPVPALDYFVGLWERTSIMPNFIQMPQSRAHECLSLVSALNSHQKIYGTISDGNQLLTDVSWKDFPGRKSNGFFCFPVSWGSSSALSPYKAGYRFSPDIVLPSPENLKTPKLFNAVKLDADFGLTDHFVFKGKVKNLIRQNDEETIANDMAFVRDGTHHHCASFSGKSYIDAGFSSRSALKSNFSVTAWIKPSVLGANNCILGKGKDFVLKIRQGELTFTVQGVKDYHSEKTPIPLGKWSFVGIVHTRSENCVSFYLNGKLTETVNLLTPYADSDYTVLIGRNLWEEYFVGSMDEIKIWDRELNCDEMLAEYVGSGARNARFSPVWLLGFLLVPFGIFVYVRRHNKSVGRVTGDTPTSLLADKVSDNEMIMPEAPEQKLENTVKSQSRLLRLPMTNEQVCCFGGLKVIDAAQNDVVKKFPPKIKRLFVLILLHSVSGQKGISSKQLSDCLWPGVSHQNAKNTRGTYMQNLKALLATCDGFRLVFKEKLWVFEFCDGYFVDYEFVDSYVDEVGHGDIRQILERLPVFLSILRRGTLLPNIEESWLDPFIDSMTNRVIECGLQLFALLPEVKYDALLLEIAEAISISDPLNEPALRKKIGILTRQGKLSLAHLAFDNFVKLYAELYGEKYPSDFKSLITSGE